MRCERCGREMAPILPSYLLPPWCQDCIATPAAPPPPTAEPEAFRELAAPGRQLGLFGRGGEGRRRRPPP